MSRAPLSKERVLAAALAIADEGGLASLSMRRLAQELGVEAMSLYHYVHGKEDIYDGIVDLVLAEIEYPAAGEAWKPALRRIAVSYRKALGRHAWAGSLMFTRTDALPGRIRYMEATLRILSETGLDAEVIDLAYHSLDSHIIGSALWAANFRGMAGKIPDLATKFLKSLPAEQYPHLIAHIHQHLSPPKKPRSAFEFGLDLILDGLERLAGPVVATRRRRDGASSPVRRTRQLRWRGGTAAHPR